jgi:hypothetical protein
MSTPLRTILAMVARMRRLVPGGRRSVTGRQRFLCVAAPGIRNYVEWGGKGILVYDIAAATPS